VLTSFEILYLTLEPLLPPLQRIVRRNLKRMTADLGTPCILDIGGRNSPYSVNLPGHITITDLPRTSVVQEERHLGLTAADVTRLLRRRSNVNMFLYDDMTHSALAPESYDLAVAIEVIEHVEDDDAFVAGLYRVLRPHGRFLLTTPNGDFVTNRNPDHKRHYHKTELESLLHRYFLDSQVEFAVASGKLHILSMMSWSPFKHPLRTLEAMAAGFLSTRQSLDPSIRHRAAGTEHLIASGSKD